MINITDVWNSPGCFRSLVGSNAFMFSLFSPFGSDRRLLLLLRTMYIVHNPVTLTVQCSGSDLLYSISVCLLDKAYSLDFREGFKL